MVTCGTSATVLVPFHRWNMELYYDPEPGAAAKSYSKHGCFVDGTELFEEQSFGLSVAES